MHGRKFVFTDLYVFFFVFTHCSSDPFCKAFLLFFLSIKNHENTYANLIKPWVFFVLHYSPVLVKERKMLALFGAVCWKKSSSI